MQSIPDRIKPGSASSPKTCAVTRAPWAWAASIAAFSTSSDHNGAKSPMPRSIQSPTSLTQPSPRRACSATASGSCDSSSMSIGRPGMYRLGRARCRPARMMRGRSSRSSRLRVSIGDPQSRSSSAPTSRSASACAIASSSSTPPCGPSPTWQCASTSPGRIQPPSKIVSASPTGSRLMRPSTIHSSMGSSSGSPIPRTCCGTICCPGNSAWTGRN